MAKTRKLAADGSWKFGRNVADTATGDEGVLIDVKTAIGEWRNDYWAGMNKGISWDKYIGNAPALSALRADIEAIVLSRPNVAAVSLVQARAIDQHTLAVEVEFLTTFGTVLTATLGSIQQPSQTTITSMEAFPPLPAGVVCSIDETGFHKPDAVNVAQATEARWREIYGNDINTDTNTPDGQVIGLLTLLQDQTNANLAVSHASRDILQAAGSQLDDLMPIVGIVRKPATYTSQLVKVEISSNITLEGLDTDINNPAGSGFTVADTNGLLYILANTVTLTSGIHALPFRMQLAGALQSPVGQITNIITTISGVVSVVNEVPPTTLGESGESDIDLRNRAIRSNAIPSVGYLNGLDSKLLAIVGVVDVRTDNNTSDATNNYGTPEHSIYSVIDGGVDTVIAGVLARTISAGCGMYGEVVIQRTLPSGTPLTVRFGRPTIMPVNIKVQLKYTSLEVLAQSAIDSINDYMITNALFKIGQDCSSGYLTTYMNEAVALYGGGIVSALGVVFNVDGSSWVNYATHGNLFSGKYVAATSVVEFLI